MLTNFITFLFKPCLIRYVYKLLYLYEQGFKWPRFVVPTNPFVIEGRQNIVHADTNLNRKQQFRYAEPLIKCLKTYLFFLLDLLLLPALPHESRRKRLEGANFHSWYSVLPPFGTSLLGLRWYISPISTQPLSGWVPVKIKACVKKLFCVCICLFQVVLSKRLENNTIVSLQS